MKNLVFLLFLGLSSSSLAQDSLQIKFRPISAGITSEISNKITDFFINRNAESIWLNAYFTSTGSASQNRIIAELRLHVVLMAIMNEGVPFNIINSSLELSEEDIENNDVKIVAIFAQEKGAHVLKNSSVVQISEIVYDKPVEIDIAVAKEIISTTPAVSNEAEKEFVLDAAAFKKDATVSLPNLIFQGSSHYFISSSERVLKALLKVMISRPDIEIELQGHVCCNQPGVDAYDMVTGEKNLSLMRAKAVYNYLIAGGVSASRMTYRGFGSSHRLYPEEKNSTEQMLNRRVEVLITASD